MYTYEELRASGNKPRVHGNGFIQLDLPNGDRLHIWDDQVPRQSTRSSVHDHVFSFKSKVICGRLINIECEAVPDPEGDYVIYTPQGREGTEDTKLASTGERVNLEIVNMTTIGPGEIYTFPPLVFHDTDHRGTTATILQKIERVNAEPRVLVPVGEEPDNDFDRDGFDEEFLWTFVQKALILAVVEAAPLLPETQMLAQRRVALRESRG